MGWFAEKLDQRNHNISEDFQPTHRVARTATLLKRVIGRWISLKNKCWNTAWMSPKIMAKVRPATHVTCQIYRIPWYWVNVKVIRHQTTRNHRTIKSQKRHCLILNIWTLKFHHVVFEIANVFQWVLVFKQKITAGWCAEILRKHENITSSISQIGSLGFRANQKEGHLFRWPAKFGANAPIPTIFFCMKTTIFFTTKDMATSRIRFVGSCWMAN